MLTHPNGHLMIEHAMNGLNIEIFDRVIITIIREHDENYESGLILSQVFGGNKKVEICILEDFTKSAAETIFLTIEKMKITGSIVVKDCDNYVSISIRNPIINSVTGYGLIGHPEITNIQGKSFLIINEQNIIQDIVEKRVVSDTICVGVYSFYKAEDFVDTYKEIVEKNIQGELFISNIISYMINRKNFIFEALSAEEYSDWGTLNEWKLIQKKMRTYFVDVDGVIVKNCGKYGRINWENNRSLLENNITVIKKLQESGAQIVITTSRTEEYRQNLEEILLTSGIKPYAILMGMNHSARVLINDFAPTNQYPSAMAVSLPRNSNLGDYVE